MTQHVGQPEAFSHMAPIPRTQLQSFKDQDDRVVVAHQSCMTNTKEVQDKSKETHPKVKIATKKKSDIKK